MRCGLLVSFSFSLALSLGVVEGFIPPVGQTHGNPHTHRSTRPCTHTHICRLAVVCARTHPRAGKCAARVGRGGGMQTRAHAESLVSDSERDTDQHSWLPRTATAELNLPRPAAELKHSRPRPAAELNHDGIWRAASWLVDSREKGTKTQNPGTRRKETGRGLAGEGGGSYQYDTLACAGYESLYICVCCSM